MPEPAFKVSKLTEILIDVGLRAASDGAIRIGVRDPQLLIEQGWEAFYAELFGDKFVYILAPHHIEAVEWHWDSRNALLTGKRPEYLAYFPMWSRGHMKSSIAERLVVADSALSIFYREPGFALYLSRNKDKVKEHVGNIETLFVSEAVRARFPTLSQVRRQEETNQKRQWTATFLHTQANFIVKGGTLDSGLAGSRINETRPTLIIPDDIDSRDDSVVQAEDRFNKLTREVLPMRQDNTLVFYPQNLISRFSVMYRIHKGHARVLTNRKPTVPIPAVRDLVTEIRMVDGIMKDVFISGESTWQAWDARRIQDEIDSEGLPAFSLECQHEVEQNREGLVLANWRDDIHVISWSEFNAMYKTNGIPARWYKYAANDFSETKSAYHANVVSFVTVAGQYEPLPGAVFMFNPLSFPARTEADDVGKRILQTIAPDKDWEAILAATLSRAGLERYITNASEFAEQRRQVIARTIPPMILPTLAQQNYVRWRGSHEESQGALRVYRECYGLPFEAANPGKTGGLAYINHLMQVDTKQPHPFRPDVEGFTRFFLIVPDEKLGYPESATPVTLHDTDLVRHQFDNWRNVPLKLTELGAVEHGPQKMEDDFGNSLQMIFHDGGVVAAPLNKMEKIEDAMPPALQLKNVTPEMSPYDKTRIMTARQVEHARITEQMDRPRGRGTLAQMRWEQSRKPRG